MRFFNKKNLGVVLGVLIFSLLIFSSVGAIEYVVPDINPSIPGMNQPTQGNPNPVGIISNIFQFALLIGGLLAFVMIVYAGIEYSASADNAGGQKDAKDRIKQALLGLLLLAGSFVLLYTINPQLTQLEFPTLKKIKGGSVYVPDFTGSPGELGGRCLNNTCSEGLFCFKDNKCYAKIACNLTDHENQLVNNTCTVKLKEATGQAASGVCSSGFCVERSSTQNCSLSPTACESGTSCVTGASKSACKLKGTEGAACNNGNCIEYPAVQCSPSVPGICVRVSANDIACGDQIGRCSPGTGNCQMDRTNIGKYKCSTTLGPDGVCPAGQTIQGCSALFGTVGGYCHAQNCYSNPTGPFPINP